MPTYAVLGATGNSPDRKINAYCRSKPKLLRLVPRIADNKQVEIFEGSLNDIKLVANCLRGTRAAFLAVASTANVPGCTIAQDTARQIITACETLKRENERRPKLRVLSSASVDHSLMSDQPALLLRVLYWAFQYVYDDLKAAERFLRSQEDLVSTTFIRPGALCSDEQRGHELDLQHAKFPLSFLDLAAGMLEVADDDSGRYDMKGVAVSAMAKDVGFPREAPLAMLIRLLFYLFPWSYRFLG
ncbi:hypothetical protein LTR56_016744 [Elasticomyces elasticus]|nr:hypothetical protein LTR56_016744 [Elasticomyces elasticus]KAK3662711.1 hypothetical protein LTR22_006562 [Elasticomyces elasticus]KAK4923389.1 hypothetical protein LTR49_009459 [Elasticomyces elasticus]KAK5753294.1 hypothetical protein LTS12_016630 [Elasticomyces elasticus]